MKDYLKNSWNNFNLREQLTIAIGSVLAVIFLFYLFIWIPLKTNLEVTKNYVGYQKNLIAWMGEASKKLTLLQSSGNIMQKTPSNALLSTLDSSTKRNHLASFMTSMQQTDDQTVLIKFDKVPFDYLINWLENLWLQNGIKVQRIDITPKREKNGLVVVNVYLTSVAN